MSAPMQKVVGQVEATNDKGVKVDGQWHNYSKFAAAEALAPAQAGQWAEISIDSSGFVRSLVVAQKSPTPAATDEPAPIDSYEEVMSSVEHTALSKDALIVRQTCLKAASEFAVNRPDVKSSDVLKIAECWERWVWR